MARTFFVGGNFKLNPISREEKRKLVKILNDADVDQSVGTCHLILWSVCHLTASRSL